MQKTADVTVTPGVSITVTPDPVEVHKNQDTVEWKGANSQAFNIVFRGSGEPAVSCGLQGSKWVCTAGPFQNTTGKKRKVKYDITASGTPTLDPEVEIQP